MTPVPTGAANRRAALAFVRRVLVFLSPLLAIGLVSQAALWRVGEAWSMESILAFEEREVAAGRETLFARVVVAEEMRRYKAAHLARRAPEIAVLGSSTSMQLRDFHFGSYADVFYNAGGLVQDPADLEAIAARWDEEGWPRFVALSLDLWWFNAGWSRSSKIETLERIAATSEFDADYAARSAAYPALVELLARKSGRALLGGLFRSEAVPQSDGATARIGLGAQTGGGFRGSDGSRRNAPFLARVAKGEPYSDDEGTLRRIERGEKRFERGAFAPAPAEQVRAFLERAKRRGAVVGGFAIPLDRAVREALRSSAGHAAQLADYQSALRELFAELDLPYVDAVDHFDLPDVWMINGFHGSERTMAHIVRGWLEHPATRAALPELRAETLDCLIREAEEAGVVEGEGRCGPATGAN